MPHSYLQHSDVVVHIRSVNLEVWVLGHHRGQQELVHSVVEITLVVFPNLQGHHASIDKDKNPMNKFCHFLYLLTMTLYLLPPAMVILLSAVGPE